VTFCVVISHDARLDLLRRRDIGDRVEFKFHQSVTSLSKYAGTTSTGSTVSF
jgi:hypothetical protein